MPTPRDDTLSAITPEELAGADSIEELKISKDGSNVIYVLRPVNKTGENMTSALWLAQTFVAESAQQVTTGAYRDYSPSFHPTTSRVFFLSDREDEGGLSQLYSLSVETSEEKVVRITSLDKEHGVASYSISPNGNFVAFIVEVKKAKKDNKDPITVWREEEKDTYATLQYIDLRESLGSSNGMKSLVATTAHVDSFSWSPDSSAIVYRLLDHRDFESHAFPVKEKIVLISRSAEEHSDFTYPRMPASRTIWRECGDFVFAQSVQPSVFSSAKCLWSRKSSQASAAALAYGVTNDIDTIVNLGAESQYAVQVAQGLLTKFDVYDKDHKAFTAFEDNLDYSMDGEWDMTLTTTGKYVFVAIRSSGVSGQSANIWSGVTESNQAGTISRKLSSHNLWFDSKIPLVYQPFSWKSKDGVKLEGVMTYAKHALPQALPVFIYPHGGPSTRNTVSLDLSYGTWRPFLASHGYLVLSPNYRGSNGRGNDFAMAAEGGVGTSDWEDIEEMIPAAISQGLVGPQCNVGIGSWSQGGFEAAWGCTRPGNKFKVGVMGAGISDWGFMAAQSDIPDGEAALGGGAPWTPGDPLYLKGSPIKDVKNVTAPILILHGKEDARVPVSQAIAFLRGIEREGQAKVKPTLVIYPREGHIFQEHAHVVDVLRRVLEYLELYLK